MALLVSLNSVRTCYIKTSQILNSDNNNNKLHFNSLINVIRQLLVYIYATKNTGCGKFALRALSQCLASEFQSQGVHVAHVIIDGVIGPPRLVILCLFILYFSLKDI